MNREAWERLSLYESQDLLSRLYRERHGGRLSSQKAKEITACLVQGRQFFAAADTAEDLTAPLILYYGVLALSRGIILFLDRRKRLTSLDPTHGAEARGWSNLLLSETGGPQNIPNVEIALRDAGTFAQLAESTRSTERCRVFAWRYPSEYRMSTSAKRTLQPVTITFRQALERIPDLHVLFERTFGEESQCQPVFALMQSVDTQTDVEFIETVFGLPTVDRVRELLQVPAECPVILDHPSPAALRYMSHQETYRDGSQVQRVLLGHSTLDGVMQHLGTLKNDRSGNMYLVARLPNGNVVSTLSLLFLVSFATGNLVRYYPSIWQHLSARGPGDASYPLLKSCISLVQELFPHLVANEMENADAIFPSVR
jgi:hypothetical protein